jgi:two-component system, NtrC family, sensor kinase
MTRAPGSIAGDDRLKTRVLEHIAVLLRMAARLPLRVIGTPPTTVQPNRMRVRAKLVTITLFAAAIPLVMSAYQSLLVHEQALNDALLQLHATSAKLGARSITQELDSIRHALRNTVQTTIDWGRLQPLEQEAALWLVLGQFPEGELATLAQRGETTHQLVQSERSASASLTTADLEEFRRVTPPAEGDVAVGAAMLTTRGGVILPFSVSKFEAGGQLSLAIGLGLRLDGLCHKLSQARPEHGAIVLLDRWNRRLCENERSVQLAPVEPSLLDVLSRTDSLYTRETAGGLVKGAVAPVGLGFKVIVEQPLASITAPTRKLRVQVVLWLTVAVVAAVGGSWVLGRSILASLELLTAAAMRLAGGVFGERIAEQPLDDEFAALARAFNSMSQTIEERDNEIQTWNRELQSRVEERGRALESTQEALLSSRKMAGLAVTTAGIAHEMNNPLTGVLGLAQVLLSRLRNSPTLTQETAMLNAIVQESVRMQQLVERMQALGGERDVAEHRTFLLASLLDGVMLSYRHQFLREAISVVCNYPKPGRHVRGHHEQLHANFLELVENALKSMRAAKPKDGGRLTVSVQEIGVDWLEVSFTDNGVGIPQGQASRVFEPFFTTKLGGKGEGLGLAQVYRTIETHGGKVWFDTGVTQGARVVVKLPSAATGVHLA